MSAPLLFNLAGALFCLTPLGHTRMAADTIWPGLRGLSALGPAAVYSAKVSWTQANGYFVVCALLSFKYAQTGVRGYLDKSILAALLVTHLSAGYAYFRKGIFPPVLIYWGTSLLLGVAALRGA